MKIVMIAMIVSMMLLASAVMADATTYGYRVSTTVDAQGKYIGWVDLTTVIVEMDGVVPKAYTEAEKPDSNCLSTKDEQVWFVSSSDDDALWYKITFNATDAGMVLPKGSDVLVYGLDYTKDTTEETPYYLPPGSMVIRRGGKGATPAGQ